MAYRDKITTSKHGTRLGLQLMSSAVSGGTGFQEFLVGPEALRAVWQPLPEHQLCRFESGLHD
jgi:hypothetical protein